MCILYCIHPDNWHGQTCWSVRWPILILGLEKLVCCSTLWLTLFKKNKFGVFVFAMLFILISKLTHSSIMFIFFFEHAIFMWNRRDVFIVDTIRHALMAIEKQWWFPKHVLGIRFDRYFCCLGEMATNSFSRSHIIMGFWYKHPEERLHALLSILYTSSHFYITLNWKYFFQAGLVFMSVSFLRPVSILWPINILNWTVVLRSYNLWKPEPGHTSSDLYSMIHKVSFLP